MRKILCLSFVICLFLISCGKKNQEELEKIEPQKPSAYISKIFEYNPAPGQFINDDSYGTKDKTKDLIGTINGGLVSLGAYGGFIVFGFDHSIINDSGADFAIYGNPLIGEDGEWSEPGIVSVMQDTNGNGLPDDIWYELAGNEYYKPETKKNYKVTYYKPSNLLDDIKWTDNLGNSGYILRNTFHAQSYFPKDAIGNTLTFEGTLLSNTLTDGNLITNKPFAFGYADNGSPEYIALQNKLGRGYNEFDINWAVDKQGNKIDLKKIDFIKVYTGQLSNGNPYEPNRNNPKSRYLGEISTEIAGAIDLRIK